MRRLLVPLVPLMVGALALAWALPANAQTAPTVKVETHPTLGKVLTDGKGMMLYLYSRDTKGVSTCFDQCEQRWPILKPPAGGPPTGSPDIGGTLGTVTRRDGSVIVTYNDIPLYYWFQDEKPGDAKGQAVGGVWWVLAPGTNQITPAVQQASPSPSPAAAAAPASLPRTGGMPLEPAIMVVGLAAAGLTVSGIGARLLARSRRRG
ncbi:MAG: hypothetical protein U0821_27815 [Chloroflexota bacterium]